MTRIELYELLGEAKISFEFDQKNDSFYGLKGDIKIRFSDLADFINDYFLPRPLFEDGTPVKVGDRILLYGIADREVTDYCVCDDGSFAINNFQYDQDQRLKKPEEKTDSWEQLEKDASVGAYDYCATWLGIDTKKTSTDEDNKAFAEDIIRRAKALAVEWEEVKDE